MSLPVTVASSRVPPLRYSRPGNSRAFFVIISRCAPLRIPLSPAYRRLALQLCEGAKRPRLGWIRPKSQGAAFSAAAPLDESAQAGDSFADNERIHLARPFVGV